ncbi:MAG: hypothetical protein AAGC85_04215 [Bacteroidota bacterium]
MNTRFLFFRLLICTLAIGIISSCTPSTPKTTETGPTERNPASEGFNVEASDPKAIEIADKVMDAMGGRKAWDDTRHISWNFFGFRTLTWDKHKGNVRIDVPSDSSTYLYNLFTEAGRVKLNGEELTEPDSVTKYLERAKRIWINDAYWLVMPFKLKDSGVTLKYVGQDSTMAGVLSDVLSLTFEEVGVTPENKYLVYVDPETNLISQWDYYQDADQESTERMYPWNDYKPFGEILLSGDRGESERGKREITDIRVVDSLALSAYTEFDEIVWN